MRAGYTFLLALCLAWPASCSRPRRDTQHSSGASAYTGRGGLVGLVASGAEAFIDLVHTALGHDVAGSEAEVKEAGMVYFSEDGDCCFLDTQTESNVPSSVEECEGGCNMYDACLQRLGIASSGPGKTEARDTRCELLVVQSGPDPTILKPCGKPFGEFSKCKVKAHLVRLDVDHGRSLHALFQNIPLFWFFNKYLLKPDENAQTLMQAHAITSPMSSMNCVACVTIIFIIGVGLFLCVKRLLPSLVCRLETPEMLKLWWTWKLDDDTTYEILRTAGVDGLMFLRFFRVSMNIMAVLLLCSVSFLMPAHMYQASKYQFFELSGGGTCGETRSPSDTECEEAASVYASGTQRRYYEQNCTLTTNHGRSVLACKKARGLGGWLELFNFQNLSEFTLDHPGIYCYTLALIATVFSVQWFLRQFMMDLMHWRHRFMISGCSRSTVFVSTMPEEVTPHNLKTFFDDLIPGAVEGSFQPTLRLDTTPSEQASFTTASGSTNDQGKVGEMSLRCSFVTFQAIRDAHTAAQMYLMDWKVEMAVEPGAFLWGSLLLRGRPVMRFLRRALAISLLVALYLLWSVPVTLISALTTNEARRALENIRNNAESSGVKFICNLALQSATGMLNAMWMGLFVSFLPWAHEGLAYLYGCLTMAEVNAWIQRHFLMFFFLYVIFLNSVTQSLVEAVWQILDTPFEIFLIFGRSLPGRSWWYIDYSSVAIIGLLAELFRPGRVVGHWLFRLYSGKDLSEQYYLNLPESYSTLATRVIQNLSIAILWSSLNPAVLIVNLLFFMLAGMVYKYEILCCFRETYDTGGLWVPVAMKNITFVLILYQITMAGFIHERITSNGTFFAVFVFVNVPLLIQTFRFYDQLGRWKVTDLYQNVCHDAPTDAVPLADYKVSFERYMNPPRDIVSAGAVHDGAAMEKIEKSAGFEDSDSDVSTPDGPPRSPAAAGRSDEVGREGTEAGDRRDDRKEQ